MSNFKIIFISGLLIISTTTPAQTPSSRPVLKASLNLPIVQMSSDLSVLQTPSSSPVKQTLFNFFFRLVVFFVVFGLIVLWIRIITGGSINIFRAGGISPPPLCGRFVTSHPILKYRKPGLKIKIWVGNHCRDTKRYFFKDIGELAHAHPFDAHKGLICVNGKQYLYLNNKPHPVMLHELAHLLSRPLRPMLGESRWGYNIRCHNKSWEKKYRQLMKQYGHPENLISKFFTKL